VPNVYELFDEKYCVDLPGGILENFENDLKIYVYPLQRGPKDELHLQRASWHKPTGGNAEHDRFKKRLIPRVERAVDEYASAGGRRHFG